MNARRPLAVRPVLLAGAFLIAIQTSAGAQAPDRSRPPTPGPAPVFTMPSLTKRTLSNGLPVWVVERHEVPVVQVNLVMRAGAAEDPSGKPGVASLASDMLDEGAGTRSALQIADSLDLLGAELQTGASMDASMVRLHVATARLEPALALMADVALRPTFPAGDLDRVRKERLTALVQARDDPGEIADAAFPRVVYGPTHRYGLPIGGTIESISAIGGPDLRSFHQRAFRPERGLLVVVGAITADDVVPLLEGAFGAWKGEGPSPAPVTVPAPNRTGRREIVLVDRPGAAQSEIRIGRVGVARSTPDYFPLVVLNTLLGGSFTSRLNQNLRETHGYSYGAYSAFVMRSAPGPFIAGAAVQTDKTAEAIREFFNEFDGLRKPIPAEELAKARSFLALRFPGQLVTTRQIAGRLEDLFLYGLPDDYYSTYVGRLQAVGPGEVAAVAGHRITPADFVIVVVGDRKTIEPGLRELGSGPVRIASIDEFLGKPR